MEITDSHQAQAQVPAAPAAPTEAEALARLQAAIAKAPPDLLAQLQTQKMQRLQPQPIPIPNRQAPDLLSTLIPLGLVAAIAGISVVSVSMPRTGEARMAEAIAAMSIEQSRRPRTQITCVFGCGEAIRAWSEEQRERELQEQKAIAPLTQPVAAVALDPQLYSEWVEWWRSLSPEEFQAQMNMPECQSQPECSQALQYVQAENLAITGVQ